MRLNRALAASADKNVVATNMHVSLGKNGCNYSVNFAKMEQTNVTSGYKRKLRKEPYMVSRPPPAAAAAATAAAAVPDIPGDDGFVPEEDAMAAVAAPRSSLVQLRAVRADLPAVEKAFRDEIAALSTVDQVINVPAAFAGRPHHSVLLACQANGLCVDLTYDAALDTVALSGLASHVCDARLLVQDAMLALMRSPGNLFRPPTWDAANPNVLVPVAPASPEWAAVEKQLRATLPAARLATIERVQNLAQYRKFHDRTAQLQQLLGDEPASLHLFHGTDRNPPSLIYADHDGFCVQFASNGQWGRGTYFAVNAAYSDAYAHVLPDGSRQLFLVKVTVGEAQTNKPMDPNITMPDVKSNSKTRYNSITGTTGGSRVYVVYDNGQAYPEYLLTYTKLV